METSGGSLVPQKFRSLPGCVFPMYHVFADIGEFASGQVLPAQLSDHLVLDGLVLRKGEQTRIILANFTEKPRSVNLVGVAQKSTVRLLDETNAVWAMQSPEEYRSAEQSIRALDQGRLALDLLPYAVARVDF
jgi:predicted phage tail protein